MVPIGEVSEITSKALAAHLLGYLNLEVDILPPLKHPVYAHNQKRLQYDAGVILKVMESEPFQDYAKIVGVFGESRQGGRCALVSVYGSPVASGVCQWNRGQKGEPEMIRSATV